MNLLDDARVRGGALLKPQVRDMSGSFDLHKGPVGSTDRLRHLWSCGPLSNDRCDCLVVLMTTAPPLNDSTVP